MTPTCQWITKWFYWSCTMAINELSQISPFVGDLQHMLGKVPNAFGNEGTVQSQAHMHWHLFPHHSRAGFLDLSHFETNLCDYAFLQRPLLNNVFLLLLLMLLCFFLERSMETPLNLLLGPSLLVKNPCSWSNYLWHSVWPREKSKQQNIPQRHLPTTSSGRTDIYMQEDISFIKDTTVFMWSLD